MTRTDDLLYFAKRAEDCRRLAADAVDSGVRSIHVDMARRYDRAAGRDEPLKH